METIETPANAAPEVVKTRSRLLGGAALVGGAILGVLLVSWLTKDDEPETSDDSES